MKRVFKTIFFLALFASLPLGWAYALDWPPSDGKPLSEIAAMVEKREGGAIFEAEFDDGLWEIKIRDGDRFQKLYIAPGSGEEIRRRRVKPDEPPPAGAMVLSALIRPVEALNLGVITEAEFDDGLWEVKIYAEREKIKLYIDPFSGKIVRQKKKSR